MLSSEGEADRPVRCDTMERNQMKPLPTIDTDLCTGCECCVLCCPTHALAMQDGKAVLAHPEWCDYDGRCENVCPVGAVELPYEIVFATSFDDSTE